MTSPRTRSFPSRPAQHRLVATVEVLDARRLMATGFTGTPVPVAGFFATPLSLVNFAGGAFSAPVALVRLEGADATAARAGNFAGTVDWGDGSAVEVALVGNILAAEVGSPGDDVLYVNGPDHTYAQPGTYTITVVVTGPGDSAPTTYTDTATISAAPVLTGALDRASDTGAVNDDDVTANTTPTFIGTAQPGTMIDLTATSVATGRTLVVGSGVADASGSWSITATPFVDGFYTIAIAATSTYGATAALTLAGSAPAPTLLVIDTAGPTITNFRVTDARTGAFTITYSDPADLLDAPTTEPNLITVNRPSPAPGKGQHFAVATLLADVPASLLSAPTVVVTGTLTGGHGKPLVTRNGVYTFAIDSSAIVSLSGVPLDGEYSGHFPTGDGQPGGDFRVKVVVKNGKPGSPIQVVTPRLTTHAARTTERPKAHA